MAVVKFPGKGLTIDSGQTLTLTGVTVTGLTAASVGPGTYPAGAHVFAGALSGMTTGVFSSTLQATKLGLGMVASEMIDVLQTGNVATQVKLSNVTAGSTTQVRLYTHSDSVDGLFGVTNSAWTTSGLAVANMGFMRFIGATGGVLIENLANAPIIFGVNAAEAARLTTTGLAIVGTVATTAPTGGAGAWKLGIANAVSPTAPNRTVTIDIGGTVYYLAAKTTND